VVEPPSAPTFTSREVLQNPVDDAQDRGLERSGILPLVLLQKSHPYEVVDFRYV
jgi:hypothetical protein